MSSVCVFLRAHKPVNVCKGGSGCGGPAGTGQEWSSGAVSK